MIRGLEAGGALYGDHSFERLGCREALRLVDVLGKVLVRMGILRVGSLEAQAPDKPEAGGDGTWHVIRVPAGRS